MSWICNILIHDIDWFIGYLGKKSLLQIWYPGIYWLCVVCIHAIKLCTVLILQHCSVFCVIHGLYNKPNFFSELFTVIFHVECFWNLIQANIFIYIIQISFRHNVLNQKNHKCRPLKLLKELRDLMLSLRPIFQHDAIRQKNISFFWYTEF